MPIERITAETRNLPDSATGSTTGSGLAGVLPPLVVKVAILLLVPPCSWRKQFGTSWKSAEGGLVLFDWSNMRTLISRILLVVSRCTKANCDGGQSPISIQTLWRTTHAKAMHLMASGWQHDLHIVNRGELVMKPGEHQRAKQQTRSRCWIYQSRDHEGAHLFDIKQTWLTAEKMYFFWRWFWCYFRPFRTRWRYRGGICDFSWECEYYLSPF